MTEDTTATVEDVYPEGDLPTTPPTEREAFDPPADTWVNFWDVNPVEHGGKFIKWDADSEMWEVIEVTPPSAWPEDEHILERHWFEPADVWVDPDNPLTGFTSAMLDILESLSDEHHLPNAEPFLENVTYYVADLTHYMRTDDRSETFLAGEHGEDVEAYWEKLESWGVDPANVEGVAEGDLPDSVTNDTDDSDSGSE